MASKSESLRCRPWALQVWSRIERWRPVVKASIAEITHSAIGSSKTPRAFVTTTSPYEQAAFGSKTDWRVRALSAAPPAAKLTFEAFGCGASHGQTVR